MVKVLLCIPPDYSHGYPPLGTPALIGFLKSKGIDASQIDLNLRYRDFLCAHLYGSNLTFDKKKFFIKKLLKKFFTKRLKGRYYSDLLVRDSDDAVPMQYYDNNTNSSFFFTERLLSSEMLERYLEDENENTFLQFYLQERITDFLWDKKIDFLGISVLAPSQAIAALTLGRLVKKKCPGIHVNIGGPWPTRYREAIAQRKHLFRYFDSVIVFDGETPLWHLIEALASKKDHHTLPNVICQDTKLREHPIFFEGENMNALPCPDFDGLPLDQYDEFKNGQANLTYEMSRGCYWSKCAYCVDLPLPKPHFRRKNTQLIINDIRKLQKKYKAGNLMLGDPSVSPQQLLEVSRAIIKNKIKISWWCFARLDPGFNKKVFRTAACAGLDKITFGFESASDRVCNRLDKGNVMARSARVIKDCTVAGITVSLQTMMGLPGETVDEALKTIDFLLTNKKNIAETGFNVYFLTPENFIYRAPQKYGIKFKKNINMPFRFFIPFENKQGISQLEALQLYKFYGELLHRENVPRKKQLVRRRGVSLTLRILGESVTMSFKKEKKKKGSSSYFS